MKSLNSASKCFGGQIQTCVKMTGGNVSEHNLYQRAQYIPALQQQQPSKNVGQRAMNLPNKQSV